MTPHAPSDGSAQDEAPIRRRARRPPPRYASDGDDNDFDVAENEHAATVPPDADAEAAALLLDLCGSHVVKRAKVEVSASGAGRLGGMGANRSRQPVQTPTRAPGQLRASRPPPLPPLRTVRLDGERLYPWF